MNIDIVNETDGVVDEIRVQNLVCHVLASMHVHPHAEVSILFVDVDHMTSLHVKWMGEDGPTDVLSFPMDELRPGTSRSPSGPGALGDVVLCPVVTAQQAAAAGHSAQHETDILLVHGMLHLLGFDHRDQETETEMFQLQRQLVDSFNEGV